MAGNGRDGDRTVHCLHDDIAAHPNLAENVPADGGRAVQSRETMGGEPASCHCYRQARTKHAWDCFFHALFAFFLVRSTRVSAL